jgi:tetratricopeptide (TPR) repeat protein
MIQAKAGLNAGIALQQQGNFAQAESIYRQWISSHARDANAWHLLATTLALQARFDEAAGAADQATRLAPGNAQFWLNRGNVDSARGDGPRALSSYQRALELRPDYAEAWFRLGLIHGAGGRLREAITAHRNALRGAPRVADIHYQLADCLAQDGHWPESAVAYEQAFALDPQRRLDRRPFF